MGNRESGIGKSPSLPTPFPIPHSQLDISMIPRFNAAALALIGPGAYSVDARLFGRRVVHLPAGNSRHGN